MWCGGRKKSKKGWGVITFIGRALKDTLTRIAVYSIVDAVSRNLTLEKYSLNSCTFLVSTELLWLCTSFVRFCGSHFILQFTWQDKHTWAELLLSEKCCTEKGTARHMEMNGMNALHHSSACDCWYGQEHGVLTRHVWRHSRHGH